MGDIDFVVSVINKLTTSGTVGAVLNSPFTNLAILVIGFGILIFAPRQMSRENLLKQPYLQGVSLRIAEIVQNHVIENRTFEDCTLEGPAVIVKTGVGIFHECNFEGNLGEILWGIPSSRKAVLGAIELRNTVFRRCRFREVGIAGPPDVIKIWLEDTSRTPPPV